MKRLQTVYQNVFQNFINNVNALGADNGDTGRVRLYIDRAFDKSTLETHGSMGANKLIICFETQNIKKMYGFHLSPDLGAEDSKLTMLGFSDNKAKALEVGYMDKFEGVVHQNDDADIDRFNLMTTFSSANSFDGYRFMFNTAEEHKPFVWGKNLEIIDVANECHKQGKDVVPLLVDLTESDIEIERFVGIQSLCDIGAENIAEERLNEMLGLKDFYNVLKDIDVELDRNPEKFPDLLSKIAENPNAALGLNTIAMYGEFYRNWSKPSKDRDRTYDVSDGVAISDDMYKNVVTINSKRESRQERFQNYDTIMADRVNTNIRCYNRITNANTDVGSDIVYAEEATISYADRYRLYTSAKKGTKYSDAVNIPAANIYLDENKTYRIATQNRDYSLSEFVSGGLTPEREGELKIIREGFTCLYDHVSELKARGSSHKDIVSDLHSLCNHVMINHVKNANKHGFNDNSCDMLAVEFKCFENDVLKNEDSYDYAILADALKVYKETQLETRNDGKLYSFTRQHQIGLPDVAKGSMEFGNMINKELAEAGAIKSDTIKAQTDMINRTEKYSFDQCSKRALSFRQDDLTYCMFEGLREKSGLPKGSSFEAVMMANKDIFKTSAHYIETWNKVVGEFNSDPDDYNKLGKLNDFIVMTDIYDPKSVESIDRIMNDINSVYDNKAQSYSKDTLYRPKNQNEISIMRALCSDDFISKYGTGSVTGENMTFDKVVTDTVKVLLENSESEKLKEVKSAIYTSSKLSDTAADPRYLNLYSQIREIESGFSVVESKVFTPYSKFNKMMDQKASDDKKWAGDGQGINDKDVTED